ncbi:MAG: Protein-N(5)-glutamine methyltransferase PrmC, methylates polypeptide chain release factors RF1 and RF2 [uncultured Caballeronia sp.]|nr:MAG: Protein-N(5)-glutamine methyltransferase PrmC, methylates polypeptide chain release factors RF1 and RF2 [uncultured Caballeronia sp.]
MRREVELRGKGSRADRGENSELHSAMAFEKGSIVPEVMKSTGAYRAENVRAATARPKRPHNAASSFFACANSARLYKIDMQSKNTAPQRLEWEEDGKSRSAHWRSESGNPPPRHL